MNLTNAVFQFLAESAAGESIASPLTGANVMETDTDAIDDDFDKTVRVGSATSEPDIGTTQTAEEFNASLRIEFLTRPADQGIDARVIAREVSHEMAMRSVELIAADESLAGRVCRAHITGKEDGYRKPQTIRYQVSILYVAINTR